MSARLTESQPAGKERALFVPSARLQVVVASLVSLVPWACAWLYYLQPVRQWGGQRVLQSLVAALVVQGIVIVIAWYLSGLVPGAFDEDASLLQRGLAWPALLAGSCWVFIQDLFILGLSIWALLRAVAIVAMLALVTVVPLAERFRWVRVHSGWVVAALVLSWSVALGICFPYAPHQAAVAALCVHSALLSSAFARQLQLVE